MAGCVLTAGWPSARAEIGVAEHLRHPCDRRTAFSTRIDPEGNAGG
jgi:hypothetical protein